MKNNTKKKGFPAEPSASSAGPVILIDSREPEFQRYDFAALDAPLARVQKLDTGDYSVEGLENIAAVERKTLDDLAKSITLDRFWAELERAEKFPRFCVIVEGTIADIEGGFYASAVKPSAILGGCLTIGAKYGIPVIWAGNRQYAAVYTLAFLLRCFERKEALREEAERRRLVYVKEEPCTGHGVVGCVCEKKEEAKK